MTAVPAAEGRGSARRRFFSVLGTSAVSVLAFFLFTGEPPYCSLSLLFGVLLHEGGHLLALALCGQRVRARGNLFPFGLLLTPSGRLCSYREELFIALAGAGVNLFCVPAAFLLLRARPHSDFLFCFLLFSLGLALFNLLPLPALDGSAALAACLGLCGVLPDAAWRAVTAAQAAASVLFTAFSAFLFASGRAGFYPLFLSLFFLSRSLSAAAGDGRG